MPTYKVLFPTDFSEGALAALPHAVSYARSCGAKLYLLHVVHDIADASGLYVPHISVNEMYRELEESARKQLENFGAELRQDIKDVEYAVLRGVPYEEILRFAREKEINIIVIGTRGRKGLDRFLFGSTAEKVVRYAPCPVLTVRGPEPA